MTYSMIFSKDAVTACDGVLDGGVDGDVLVDGNDGRVEADPLPDRVALKRNQSSLRLCHEELIKDWPGCFRLISFSFSALDHFGDCALL